MTISNLYQNWEIFNILFFYFSEIPKMDLNKAITSLMAFKASSVSSKTKLSRSGIFQLPSLGIKLIVILQIISIQINIHSVTGKFSVIIIDYRFFFTLNSISNSNCSILSLVGLQYTIFLFVLNESLSFT